MDQETQERRETQAALRYARSLVRRWLTLSEARKATPEGVQTLKDLRLECQSLPWIRDEGTADD